MSQPLVYVDTSQVREGALAKLKEAIARLAEFVQENEPEILSFAAYFTEDESQLTVIHVHNDSASLEYHMEVAGPLFGRFADLVTLSSIHIYGEPSDKALAQLQQKVRLLGSGGVLVHAPHAGFSRFVVPEHKT